MGTITENINRYRASLPQGVKLCAVSKFHPISSIQEAYDTGQRIFGESRVQELLPKQQNLPADIEWHFIGHLQTNKVKYIAPFITLIHSGDSVKLLKEINSCAKKEGRVIDVLLQLHVAKEQTKSGFMPSELDDYMAGGEWRSLSNIQIRGVMGMATYTDDEELIESEFKTIRQEFEKIKRQYFPENEKFSYCSMGMSDDYPLAIACGSNIVRVGTGIFGERIY
ncbi:MAG: YggS family pyridoxal phosphate-dependent enzyme [Bacteroidales bacterium]|nr:YggS family pyridoxal phosphate-dependent enzyme [Bacteroidales bacterium]MBR5531697.1 YggS family pyridoxal phosphate-dependent enzyme [Bacteroidales bacterium]